MSPARPVVVVLDDWEGRWASSPALDALRRAADVRVLGEHQGRDGLARLAGDAQVLVLNRERTRVDGALLATLPALRAIVNTGVGLNHLDREAAERRGIRVVPTGGEYTSAVVEQTFALMLAAVKHLPALDATVRGGGFPEAVVLGDLHGARLGIAGVGNVGRGVARVALAFGMRVTGWSPRLGAAEASALGIGRAATPLELAASSDVLAVCLRLTPQTRGIISREIVDAIPSGALVVNTARAELVDGAALLERAERGEIGLALDVFEHEPEIDARYRRYASALSPHVAWKSERTWAQFVERGVEAVLAELNR